LKLREVRVGAAGGEGLPVLITVEVGGGEVRGMAGGEGLKLQC